jgi:hypothetical protein
MPDITDPEAIAFSNRSVRTAADNLATLYYECDYLRDLKIADDDTPTTIALREGHIRSVADLMLQIVQNEQLKENVWFNVGSPSPMNSTINNNAAFDMADGSPEDGRPPITGSDVHAVMNRVIDLDDWLEDGAFGLGGGGVQRQAMLNTLIVVSSDGNTPLQVSQVNLFIDNRCGEIVTEYEANSNTKLTHLLTVAPNPRNPI